MKRNTQNDFTELVFILDRSGSMAGLETDTIGGFNAMLEKQKKQPGRCLVSTVLFDHETLVVHDRVPLQNVAPLTRQTYFVRGATALCDAIGGAVHHIGTVHKYARRQDVPAHTLFVIMTDGLENASRVYSAPRVRAMIERQKERFGWEFLFIGANMDAVETAGHFGIGANRAVDYRADSRGTKTAYESVAAACACVRANALLAADWSADIRRDHEDRR